MSGLSKYKDVPLVINQNDAWYVLSVFWNPPGIEAGALTEADRIFAQALVLECADASAKIGFIESLWKSSAKPTATAKAIFKSTAKALLKYYMRDKSVQAAVDGDKYLMVISTLANNFSSPWKLRKETEDTSWIAL